VERKREPITQPAFLASARFGTSFLTSAIQSIVLPFGILLYVSDRVKGTHVGLISTIAAAAGMFVFILFGNISDRSTHRFGRRRPFMVLGAILANVALILLAYAHTYLLFAAFIILVLLSKNIIESVHLPLLPDLISEERMGRAAAYFALFAILGTMGGVITASFILDLRDVQVRHLIARLPLFLQGPLISIYPGTPLFLLNLALIVVLDLSILAVCLRVKERRSQGNDETRPALSEMFTPGISRYPNFRRFLFSRFFGILGLTIILIFMLYITRDILRAENYKRQTGVILAIAALGVLVASGPSGKLADRYRKKHLIYFGIGLLITSLLSLIVFMKWRFPVRILYFFIFVFGVGNGAVYTATFALGTIIIPEKEKAGKYMSLMSMTTFLAQITAPIVGGVLLDFLNSLAVNLGYLGLILLVEICFFIAGITIRKVRECAT
jgi:MFS family permease